MTKDDLLHQPKSGLIDMAAQRKKDSEFIARQVEEFKAKGGKITVVGFGVISDINRITKKPYNNAINDKMKRL